MTGRTLGAMVNRSPSIPTLEAAERLGIDVLEVYRLIDEGRLTAAWDGQRLVVPAAEIESLAASSR